MFVSASPEHWCRIPELDNLTNILSLEDRKALSLPYRNKSDGKREYSKCLMYDVNYTAIIENWMNSAYDGTSQGGGIADVADTGGGLALEDVLRADLPLDGGGGGSSGPGLGFGDESYGSTVNPTSLLRFPRRLPPPPVSDPTWPIVQCRYGWNYDNRDYDSTLVTEVNSTRAAFRSSSLIMPVCMLLS